MYKQRSKLTELLAPVVSALGYDMLGIQYLRQKHGALMRVYIDCDAGVTVDDCVRVNKQVVGVLDSCNLIKEHYDLEISSPGLDRPLFTLAQFKKFIGREVILKLHKKMNGHGKIVGTLKAVQDAAVLIDADETDNLVPEGSIASAHLVPSYDP